MTAHSNAPVIIKRKKVSGEDGHHGGAWKVAYADFVTAMMAFFLLMWLLGATSEKQRKGIADFFNPSIPVNRVSGGGDGAFGGDSVLTENTLAQNGTGAAIAQMSQQNKSLGRGSADASDEAQAEGAEAAALAKVESALMGFGGESMVSELLQRHVVSRLTDEGLVVEIFDLPDLPLFETGSDTSTPTLEDLIVALVDVFSLVVNDIAIQGHVAAQPIVLAENQAWDLSAARAQRVRQLLEESGIAASRIQRVTGFADRKPTTANQMLPRNNRIELILLRDRL